ncbi:hypothetical protein DERP_004226 [Dermatophagoides pteronyssinus]|uniref:Uncharacterized protein n=1 Tax=Dermatophagoides pteronyssinus TaxID=6956 RepID=A0ABQ8J8J0_DERPT|nr:hypothetical protein DERP_004226 [Dermatophagoides pteronyssinus]
MFFQTPEPPPNTPLRQKLEINDEIFVWNGEDIVFNPQYNDGDFDLSDEDVNPPEPFYYESGDDTDIWN